LGLAIVALIGAVAGNEARNEARAADMPVLKAPMRGGGL
jgi:hypothetical protein